MCHDSEQRHAPVTVRMCPATSTPQPVAARPCEATAVFEAKQGAFLAHTTSCFEELYLTISTREMKGAWREDGWHGMEVGKLCQCPRQCLARQRGKGGERLRDALQGELILLIKAASSQGLDNRSCCRLFTAVEFNTPMNKASRSREGVSRLLTLLHGTGAFGSGLMSQCCGHGEWRRQQ